MKARELKQKSTEELAALLGQKRSELAGQSFLVRQKKLKNVRGRAFLRKDIARILTMIRL